MPCEILHDFLATAKQDSGQKCALGLPKRMAIAAGGDSYVFKHEDYVLKIYCAERTKLQPISKEKLSLYQETTNSFSPPKILGWGDVFEFNGLLNPAPILVNPIKDIVWSDELDCYVGVSKFIPGHIVSEKVRGFTEGRIVNNFWAKMNRDLCDKAGVCGIEITGMNVKISPELNALIITDLCTSIRALSKRM